MRPSNNLENKIPSDLKSSASMYGNSSSHYFRTTTGIPPGLHTFDESRLVMTFLINLEFKKYVVSHSRRENR